MTLGMECGEQRPGLGGTGGDCGGRRRGRIRLGPVQAHGRASRAGHQQAGKRGAPGEAAAHSHSMVQIVHKPLFYWIDMRFSAIGPPQGQSFNQPIETID
jgi:hypothetical protein